MKVIGLNPGYILKSFILYLQPETPNINLDVENMDSDWLPHPLFYNTPKNSDFFKMLVQNFIKESSPGESHWIVDHQRKFWMEETKNGLNKKWIRLSGYKMRHQSSRIRKDRFDQRSTRRPKTIKIFVPQNNNRFDAWGG